MQGSRLGNCKVNEASGSDEGGLVIIPRSDIPRSHTVGYT